MNYLFSTTDSYCFSWITTKNVLVELIYQNGAELQNELLQEMQFSELFGFVVDFGS